MAERQALRYQVLDSSGVPIAGANIQVAQLDTTTDITQTMYAGLTGATTIANPLVSDASGWVQAYFDGTDAVALKRVTVIPTKTGFTFTTRNVQLGSDYGVLDDGVAPIKATTVDATDRFNMARGSAGDPTSLQVGDMWYNTTTNALQWEDNTGTQTVSSTTGDITGVEAGDGLTGGGVSGDVTLNVGAGNAINVDADDVDVSVNNAATAAASLAGDDKILISDTDDSNITKSATISQINPTMLDGGNNKVYYTDSSGDVTELALGSANQVLTSAGATSPPTFTDITGGSITGLGNDKILYTDNSGVLSEVALGANGTVLQSTGATSAPAFAAAGGAEVMLNVAAGKSVTAGEPVVIDASGTTGPVTLTQTVNSPSGGQYTPPTTRGSWWTDGWDLVYNTYDDIYWLFYQTSGSNYLEAMPLSVSATGTVTLFGSPTYVASNMMGFYQVSVCQGTAAYGYMAFYLTALTTSGYFSHIGGYTSGATVNTSFNNIMYYTSFGGYPRACVEGEQQGGGNLDAVIVFGRYAQSYGYGGWWQGITLTASGGLNGTGSFYNSSPASGTYFDRPAVVYNPNMGLGGSAFQVVYQNDATTALEAVSIRWDPSAAGYSGTAVQLDTQGYHSQGQRLLYIDTVGGSRFVASNRKGWDGSSASSSNEWAMVYCFTKTTGNDSGFTIGNGIQSLIGSASAGTYTAAVAQSMPSIAWDATNSALIILTRENSTGSPNGVAQGSYFTVAEFSASTTLALRSGMGPSNTETLLLAGAQEVPMAMVWNPDTGYALFRYGTSSTTGSYWMRAVEFELASDKEDYIGIAQTSETAGNPVAVKHIGSVDENQTGLTITGKYYVQDDGSLSTVTSTVPAGRALSATKLLLKDNF